MKTESEVLLIETSDRASVVRKFAPLVKQVQAYCGETLSVRVTSLATKESALESGGRLNQAKKEIERVSKELQMPFKLRAQEISEYTKELLAPIEPALNHVKAEIAKFALEEERRNQEKIRKLEAEARKKEAEAKAKAEAQRLAHEKEMAEIKAKAKKEMEDASAKEKQLIRDKQRLELEKAKHEQEKREAKAAIEREAKEKQLEKQQKELEQRKIESVRRRWTFEITDASAIPDEYYTLDEIAVRRAIGNGVRSIPGIRIFQENSVVLG